MYSRTQKGASWSQRDLKVSRVESTAPLFYCYRLGKCIFSTEHGGLKTFAAEPEAREAKDF